MFYCNWVHQTRWFRYHILINALRCFTPRRHVCGQSLRLTPLISDGTLIRSVFRSNRQRGLGNVMGSMVSRFTRCNTSFFSVSRDVRGQGWGISML